jgi:hypothetical protein
VLPRRHAEGLKESRLVSAELREAAIGPAVRCEVGSSGVCLRVLSTSAREAVAGEMSGAEIPNVPT